MAKIQCVVHAVHPKRSQKNCTPENCRKTQKGCLGLGRAEYPPGSILRIRVGPEKNTIKENPAPWCPFFYELWCGVSLPTLVTVFSNGGCAVRKFREKNTLSDATASGLRDLWKKWSIYRLRLWFGLSSRRFPYTRNIINNYYSTECCYYIPSPQSLLFIIIS